MWFWWGIISAVFGALSTVLIKHSLKRVSPLLSTWALVIFPVPVALILFLQNPSVTINIWFWIGICGSAVIFTFAKLWSTEAMQKDLLSKLIPLSSFGTFFLYFWGLIFLGEQIKLLSFIGILMIVSGAYLLNIETAKENILEPILLLFKNRNSRLFLIAMLLGSFISIFDKLALVNSYPQNPIFIFMMENVVTIIPFTLYIIKKEPMFLTNIKNNFWILLVIGIIYAISVIAIFYGFMSGPVVLAVTLRQTQVIMIMILSFILFADKPPKHIWLATLIMIMGVVLVKVG